MRSLMLAQVALTILSLLCSCGGRPNIEGRLVASDGTTPIANTEVHVRPAGATLRYYMFGWNMSSPIPEPLEAVRTDDDGRFAFYLEPGEYAFHGLFDAWQAAILDPVRIVEGSEHADVLMRLPESGALEGRIVLGDPEEAAHLVIKVLPQGDPARPAGAVLYSTLAENLRYTRLEPDGSFHVAWIRPGPARINLIRVKPGTGDLNELGLDLNNALIGHRIVGETEILVGETAEFEVQVSSADLQAMLDRSRR